VKLILPEYSFPSVLAQIKQSFIFLLQMTCEAESFICTLHKGFLLFKDQQATTLSLPKDNKKCLS